MNEEQLEVINSMKRVLEDICKNLASDRVTEEPILFQKYQNNKVWVEKQIDLWQDYFET
ncbi:MAG: hypothetical protein WC388_00395 [Bacteroidales bacterium]|jgi:hypothetical protein